MIDRARIAERSNFLQCLTRFCETSVKELGDAARPFPLTRSPAGVRFDAAFHSRNRFLEQAEVMVGAPAM